MAFKLFLGGVSMNTTTEMVHDHFSKYGAVADAIVMMKDGKHRGFGFVTFESEDSMNDALAEEQVIDGRTIDVKSAVPQNEAPSPRGPPPPRSNGSGKGRDSHMALPSNSGKGSRSSGPPCDKVFIGGLPQTTSDDVVRDYFAQYGTIVDCVVMKDKETGRSRGFGFVQYDSTAPVDQVMTEYASHEIDGKWVEVKRAVPQDKGGLSSRGGKGAPSSPYGKGRDVAPSSYDYGKGGDRGKGAAPSYGAAYGAYSPYGAPPSYGAYPPPSYGYYAPPPSYGNYEYPPAYGGPPPPSRSPSAGYGVAPSRSPSASNYSRPRPY